MCVCEQIEWVKGDGWIGEKKKEGDEGEKPRGVCKKVKMSCIVMCVGLDLHTEPLTLPIWR